MHKVKIDDIEREEIYNYKFDGKITELNNCEIQADINFKSVGDFIETSGHINGHLTLECDRCMNDFVYNLDFDFCETYAKNSLYEEYGQEVELSEGQFVIDLEGSNEIDVYDLLYQSVILSLPNRKVCGINCNEGLFVSEEDIKIHDDRMNVFRNIIISKK